MSLNMHSMRLFSSDPDTLRPVTLAELECNTIKMLFESRPRSNGMKFGISVGGLYLRDKMTHNSIIPVLITPQNRVITITSETSMNSSNKLMFKAKVQAFLGRARL